MNTESFELFKLLNPISKLVKLTSALTPALRLHFSKGKAFFPSIEFISMVLVLDDSTILNLVIISL